ncbi:MAG TPA: hotdog fold thioesterase [Microbacteriaceae bacterium]|nr:hotdog fold thioesterase [Microbacteriaceae bacterium]
MSEAAIPGVELAERMGIQVIELSADHAVATMPVEGNRQVSGVVHGGAYCVLAETLGSLAAGVHAGPGWVALGIDINATHTRAASSGIVTGECTALFLGRTMTVHEIVVTDEQGRRLSTARITNTLRRLPADA